jgi:hypothetical protein
MSLRASTSRLANRIGDRLARSRPDAAASQDQTGDSPLPGPRSEAGSRELVDGFFDRFPVFYETSETSASRWRLNLRHEAIFTENRDLFDGASVLDIASHDGRWSLAALEAGAAHVVGVEARPELIEHAARNLTECGIDAARWRFVQGDVFEVLKSQQIKVDVVLCLGFFYHTLRHTELLAGMRQTGASSLVIDTEIHRSDEPVMWIGQEHVERQGNAVADELSFGDIVLTGRPSVPSLERLARGHGFELERLSDWAALLRDNPGAEEVRDYRIGRRITGRFERLPGAVD